MGAAPTSQFGAFPRRRLFYSRDNAGWNNVRINFEATVCAARLLQRELVLPPPSLIDHMGDRLFHELQVYDAPSLAGQVDISTALSPGPHRTFSGSLSDLLREGAAGLLEADVFLDASRTRLEHFECLDLPAEEARVAASTVLALQLAQPYHEAARNAEHNAGLSFYHGVHLRRGDFASFRPETQWSGSDLQGRIRRAFPASEKTWPLLVACAVNRSERDPFPELVAGLPERRVVRTDELYGPHSGAVHRVVVDGLLLARSTRFVGTPDSTYSAGVWHWRARDRVLAGLQPEEPRGLGDDPALDQRQCWQRCTNFAALLPHVSGPSSAST